MNKDECINLILENFMIEATVKNLKNVDLTLKSRELYYIDVFKEFKELQVMRVSSKKVEDDIIFDIYFNAEDFGGIFNGYFKIQPKTENAILIFSNVSKICTDLKEYFYYVFKETKLLKTYLVSEVYKSVFNEAKNEIQKIDYSSMMKAIFLKLADYKTDEFETANLKKIGLNKYVTNFIKFNSKCSEYTKMFLLNLLIKGYSNHIFFCNGKIDFPFIVKVNTEKIFCNLFNDKLSEYVFLDNLEEHNLIMFVAFDYDFKSR